MKSWTLLISLVNLPRPTMNLLNCSLKICLQHLFLSFHTNASQHRSKQIRTPNSTHARTQKNEIHTYFVIHVQTLNPPDNILIPHQLSNNRLLNAYVLIFIFMPGRLCFALLCTTYRTDTVAVCMILKINKT